MSFTATRQKMKSFQGAKTSEYQRRFLSQETKEVPLILDNRFVEYLTNDVTATQIEFNIKQWLTSYFYNSSNTYAKECLEVSLSVSAIYGLKIRTWTDLALKCYDNFLLKHIQQDRKETIPSQPNAIKERDVYYHLISLGGELSKIGEAFNEIYKERNQFQHIQIIEPQTGHRVPKNISKKTYNKKRDVIIQHFRNALTILLSILQKDVQNNKLSINRVEPK